MRKRRRVSGITTVVLACLALLTVGVLHSPEEIQTGDTGQMSAMEPQGFFEEMTIHVIPVIPRSVASTVSHQEYLPGLLRQVDAAAMWYNKAALGKRIIFARTVGEDPKVLTPKRGTSESPSRSSQYASAPATEHECDDLIELAHMTAASMGSNALVVVIAEETWQCPFSGLAGFRTNWAIITQWDTRDNQISQPTLIHELGHTLGLPHARSYSCHAAGSVYEKRPPLAKCSINEYGDPHDPMGRIAQETRVGFNAFNRYLLGWNADPVSVSSPGVQAVRVPVATSGGPAYVEIPGGYLISYRAQTAAPNDIDAQLGGDSYFDNTAGIYLHRKASNRNDGSTYPVFLPFHRLRPTARAGDHFFSQEANAAFVVTGIDEGKGANIEIHVGTEDRPVRDLWAPSVVLLEMRELSSDTYYLQWDAADPSGIVDAFAVVDGKRQNSRISTTVLVEYRKRPRQVFFVAIDSAGNRAESEVFVVPALKQE